MRERFTKAFYAVSAAAITIGVGLAAGPATAATATRSAGPALGPTIGTLSSAGYQTSGRNFRWIASQIEVPDSPSSWHSQSCAVGSAPSYPVAFTGTATASFVVTDTTRSVTLTEGIDYSVLPGDHPIALTGAVITLINSGDFKAGDLLTTTVAGGSVTSGGTFIVPTPVATCGTLSHGVYGPVTVYDTNNNRVLYSPADYAYTHGATHVDMVASGNWDFGDVLHVISGVFPSAYIQLSNTSLPNYNPGHSAGGQYVRVGVEPCVMAAQAAGFFPGFTCTSEGSWVAFFESFRNSISFFPYFRHFVVLPNSISAGDGVGFSLYYNVTGNELFGGINLPNGTSYNYQGSAHGAIFNYAAALVDFTNSTGVPAPLNPFGHRFIVNQFLKGAVTTLNGAKGSFTGPWKTSPIEATSNGMPWPSGTPRAIPGTLWSDGFMANGAIRPWDAFNVIASK